MWINSPLAELSVRFLCAQPAYHNGVGHEICSGPSTNLVFCPTTVSVLLDVHFDIVLGPEHVDTVGCLQADAD